jgi:hypothetical protein
MTKNEISFKNVDINNLMPIAKVLIEKNRVFTLPEQLLRYIFSRESLGGLGAGLVAELFLKQESC